MDGIKENDEISNERPDNAGSTRKRIPLKKPVGSIIKDPLLFEPNKCSNKAKKIFTEIENITIELWFDKHYHDRNQHGDDNGKREGIGDDVVTSLVRRSIKFMLLYSSLVKGFNFLNRDIQPNERPLRIVLQEGSVFGLLNVIIEAHFLSINHYEITVKTAMCKDDFKLSDNQYVIEIEGESSVLKKCDLKKVTEICSV